MASHDFSLAVAFLELQPKAAARALTSMHPEDAGAFLNEVSASIATGVVSKMSAAAGMAILSEMVALEAASILAELDDRDAIAILRLMSDPARSRILMALPKKLRRDFEKSICHPPNLVGAKMTTGIVIVDGDDTVKEARDRLRRLPDDGLDVVYIVDSGHRLLGYLSAFDLLRYPSDKRLSELSIGHVNPISSHAALANIAESKRWSEHRALPVINRQKQLIGAILKNDVLDDPSLNMPSHSDGSASLTVDLAIEFVACFVGLAELLTGSALRKNEDVK